MHNILEEQVKEAKARTEVTGCLPEYFIWKICDFQVTLLAVPI